MKLKPINIAQTASASSIVFNALRKAIIDGDLSDGEPLRQDEIAKLFNTSRIPVREAISRLEEQGLVKTERYKGAVVSALTAEDMAEIFDFRAVIEPEIMRHAVPNMTDEDLQTARDYCGRFAQSDDPAEWGDLNREFHTALFAASDLTFHQEVAQNAINRVERFLRYRLTSDNRKDLSNAEHQEILEACEARDAKRAAKLTRDHILGNKVHLIKAMKR